MTHDSMIGWVNANDPMFHYGEVGTGFEGKVTSALSDAISIVTNMPVGSQDKISQVCDGIKEMLLEKNRKYGDSALNPVRIFSKADAAEQIRVRIDDKLSRLQSGQVDEDEDVINDLIGYLILYKVALSNQ